MVASNFWAESPLGAGLDGGRLMDSPAEIPLPVNETANQQKRCFCHDVFSFKHNIIV